MDEYQPPQVTSVEELNGMLISCASGDFRDECNPAF